MFAYITKRIKVGSNDHGPRLWMEGKYLIPSGFIPGLRYSATVDGNKLLLSIATDGTRIISAKARNGQRIPVLDLNSRQLLQMFEGMSAVRIILKRGKVYVMPLASEVRRKERLNRLMTKLASGDALRVGSLCHGGGVMSRAVHEGLAEGGIESRIGFANEVREDLLNQSLECNPMWDENSQFIAAPVQEVAFDEYGSGQIGLCELAEVSLPCSGASVAGRSKNKISMPEEHPDVGHLLVSALAIIARCNPVAMIWENVEAYFKSASGAIIRNQLRDLGYTLHERVLKGTEFNELEDRSRTCIVAVTEGMVFSFEDLVYPEKTIRHLGEILEDLPDNDSRWSTMTGLKEKELRDKEARKGFRMQVFAPGDTRIGCITKGYAKVRSTDPKIAHPSDPNLLRQLTPIEHARAKGIPEEIVSGLSQTTAHELLGQSVLFAPFKAVGNLVARCLKRFKEEGEVAFTPQQTRIAA